MTFTVYKLTNQITGQLYFGYTHQTMQQRLSGHKGEPRNTLISRSIRKYGINNFSVEVVRTFDQEEPALQQEVQLIAEHKTNRLKFPKGNGLNMTDGGEGASGYKHTAKQRQKWKQTRKGQFAGDKHPAWGKFGANNPCAKRVYVYHADTKHLFAVYDSIRDAAKDLDVHPSNISKCCSDKYPNTHSLKGFMFSKTPLSAFT